MFYCYIDLHFFSINGRYYNIFIRYMFIKIFKKRYFHDKQCNYEHFIAGNKLLHNINGKEKQVPHKNYHNFISLTHDIFFYWSDPVKNLMEPCLRTIFVKEKMYHSVLITQNLWMKKI